MFLRKYMREVIIFLILVLGLSYYGYSKLKGDPFKAESVKKTADLYIRASGMDDVKIRGIEYNRDTGSYVVKAGKEGSQDLDFSFTVTGDRVDIDGSAKDYFKGERNRNILRRLLGEYRNEILSRMKERLPEGMEILDVLVTEKHTPEEISVDNALAAFTDLPLNKKSFDKWMKECSVEVIVKGSSGTWDSIHALTTAVRQSLDDAGLDPMFISTAITDGEAYALIGVDTIPAEIVGTEDFSSVIDQYIYSGPMNPEDSNTDNQ